MTEHITLKHGEDLVWWNELKYTNGTAANLTGITASSQMRAIPDGAELIAEGECTIDAEHGTITTLYESAVTEDIVPGEYAFDIWLDANGQRISIDEVAVTIRGRYTEPED